MTFRALLFTLFTSAAVAAEDPFAALTADLKPGRCEKELPGADGWFVGDFHFAEDGSVTGSERWLLYPNKRWADQGVKACEVQWTIKGRLSGPGTCASCALHFSFHATADKAGSECPKELLYGRDGSYAGYNGKVGGEANDFDQQYDVDVAADGTAVVKFAKSGREVGRGIFKDGRLGYLSPHQCKFW